MKRLRIAIVVPNLTEGGGVPTVADFVYSVFTDAQLYQVDLVSLATSSSDETSVQLRKPGTWRRGIRMQEGLWKNRPFRHVGAWFTEFEFCRYLPRKVLTEMLNQYDGVIVISGSPAWAYVTRNVQVPVILQTATLVRMERRRQQATERGPIALWRRVMTAITAQIDRKALHAVDVVLVENRWMQEFVTNEIGPDRVLFAPPGVDTRVYRPSEDPASVEPYILSVGRFADPRKNVPLLFEGYAELRRCLPNAPRLVLAGNTGPSDSDWALARKLQVREHIEFRQDVSPEDLAQLYRQATIFVLASDEEGLGMVLLEAMASGVPAVSTRSGGPEGIISDGIDGFLVPLGDPMSLSTAMAQILSNDGLRSKMSDAARLKVEMQFSMEAAGGRFLHAYDRLLRSDVDRGSKG